MTAVRAPYAALERPLLERRSNAAKSLGNVWAVLRRELGARMFTSAYLWSTLIFALMSFAGPFLLTLSSDNKVPVIALSPESAPLEIGLETLTGDSLEIVMVDSSADGERALRDGSISALLARSAPDSDTVWSLVSAKSVDTDLLSAVEKVLSTQALSSMLLEAGVTPEDISAGIADSSVAATSLAPDGGTQWEILLALGFGAVTVFVIILWGATMAADVVQEKATRVVEIIIATIKPWQLLAGKVISITFVGLLQVAVILVASYFGIERFGDGIDLSAISLDVIITGMLCVALGVPLLSMLMAAMAARVEHQDDLGTATQPVYLLLTAPFAAAVFVGLNAPDGWVLDALSLAPITNIFAMPVRVAVAEVPMWQLAISLSIGIATMIGSALLAGRIYSNSILRAGTPISLRQSLRHIS